MRITFVTPRSWPSVGGAQSFLRHPSGALSQRHDVRIIALSTGNEPSHRLWESVLPPPAFESFVDHDVRIDQLVLPPARRAMLVPLAAQVVPGLRRYAYGSARRLNADLYARTVAPLIARAARGSDVLHMWGTGLLGAAAVRAARILEVPIAITPFAHRGQWGDDRTSAETYSRADCVLALLETDAALYRELGPTKVEVCGICSPGVVAGGGIAIRERYRIGGRLVVFVGVRRPYKGFQLLRDAVPLVPDTTFAFVGPGEGIAGDRIIDAGLVDERDLAAWLDAANVFCLPSAAEIFPVSILESWSAGTAIVTSDIPSLRELVDASGSGVAVPRQVEAIAGALRALLGNPAELRRAGEAGRRRFLDIYSPEAVSARHEQVYNQLIEEAAACAA